MVKVWLALIILGIMSCAWLLTHDHYKSECRIVHVARDLADGQAHHGCPQGSIILRNFFTEPDGTKIDACLKPDGDDCVDELRPGESMKVFQ
jgi:hypothetical protein